MYKFLFKIGLFLIPVISFIGLTEYFVTQIPNNYSYKENLILNKSYKGVVLGNSHAYRGIIAKNIDQETINLANVSQSIDIDYEILKEVIKEQPPDYLIVNLSFPTFYGRLKYGESSWRIKNYNIYTSLQLDYRLKNNLEILSGQFKDDVKQLYNYNNLGNDNVSCLSNGSEPSNNIKNLEKSGKIAAQRHMVNNYRFLSENKSFLDEIIQLSKKHDIHVILVTPPSFEAYRNELDDNMLSEIFQYVEELQAQNKNLVYINLFSDKRFQDDMFKDGDHLNVNGAEFFTKLINHEINLCYK